MIYFSSIVLLLGLQYHEMSLDTGAQTIRLGWAGPVSYVLGGMTLAGRFYLFCLCHPSYFICLSIPPFRS
jgi:hypothetical protein